MIRLGILGLGPAGRAMIPYVDAHPRFDLAAVCDVRSEALDEFAAARPDVACHATLDALLADTAVEAVFVATPTWMHAAHAIGALDAGRHVIVEKPMAITLADAQAMAAASGRAGRALIVGHSQSFEPGVQVMRAAIASGHLGRLRAINAINYTDWMFRPRHPAEFDRSQGGGTVYRQAAHQIDIVRYLAGGAMPTRVRSTVGDWDPGRRGDGAYSAWLEFEDGCIASLFYSGYDHLAGTELTFGIGETGREQKYPHAVARRQLETVPAGGAAKYAAGSRQAELIKAGTFPAFFGLVIASCEHGDIRLVPEGVQVLGDRAQAILDIDGLPQGRTPVLDALADAVDGRAVTHDARWGAANLEVCLAMLASSDRRDAVALPGRAPLPVAVSAGVAAKMAGLAARLAA